MKHSQILIIGIFLIIFGLLAVYSVSIYESFSLTLRLGDPTNYFYFNKQISSLIYIVIAAFVAYKIPLRWFKNQKLVAIIFVLTFIFQLLVFTPIGADYGGARGWISLPILPNMQPSEVFKLVYVIFLSGWLMRKKGEITDPKFVIRYIILNALLFAIFLFIPDFGTILIMGITALVMVWYAGLTLKRTVMILVIGAFAGIFAGLFAGLVNERYNYIQNRFSYFFSADKNNEMDKKGVGWQGDQALLAIGGGGFLGKGYGKGLQKFGYIPEAQSDFIFAAIAEEIGFVGSLLLLFLYCWLFFYFLRHLQEIKDPHYRLLGVGIISLIIVQAFVNIGVNVQILPNTGITLPFISAGGTSLMINVVELIILFKILKGEK